MAERDLRPDIMTAIEGFERAWVDGTMQNISKRVKACDQSAPLDTMSCDCMTYIREMIEAAVSRGAKDALYTFAPTDTPRATEETSDA